MSDNGRAQDARTNNELRWSGRVMTAETLVRALNGERQVVVAPGTVITPLARDHLRALGVDIKCEADAPQTPTLASWGLAHERPYPLIQSAVQALGREGVKFNELVATGAHDTCQWARQVAECVTRPECGVGVVFCETPGLTCCIANKVRGVRAAVVTTSQQASRMLAALSPNLVVLAASGWTFFELKQILRTVCRSLPTACAPNVSRLLEELDGHAHR